ncbi:MAG: DUF4982 domain-containing protein, partial [Bacteroidales bacterium]|nr:DUF4982 domain-containing protein [Bacteroidales bacterium]
RILFFVLLLGVLNTAGAFVRTTYNFNPDWKLFIGDPSSAENVQYDDSKWKAVNLPAAFNAKSVFKTSTDQLADTIAWYRKTFCIPGEYKGQKVFIEFEGARQAAEIWVNGQRVGLHENGVMAFGFDLTNYVTFGKKENVIAVRVNNSSKYQERATGSAFQWNDPASYASDGGLNKNVFLHITDKLYQTLPLFNNLKTKGVYIYADNFDIKGKRAVLHIESEVRNDYDKPKTMKINVMVRDNEKLLIREFQSEEVTLQPGETKLITASANMKNLQFWSWGFGYLYEVNTTITVGKNVLDLVRTQTGFRKTSFINGVFKLNDRVLQLKGYAQPSTNEWPGVGSSVPAWLSDYSNSLMVEGNANLVRWMHVTPWKQDIESCDRIGLLEVMPAGDKEKDVDGRMWEQRKELMREAIIYNRNNPSIIFYECGNAGISEAHMSEMLAIRNEFDPRGGRAMGCRDMLDSKVAEYGGEMCYVNKSASKPVFAMEYGSGENIQHQDLFAMDNVLHWYDYWRERPGTGKRVNSGAVSILFSDSGSPLRGGENHRSGKTDAMRITKDAWWAHYVMWDGWVDLENFHTQVVGHWNYEKGSRNNVYVISSGKKVELFLNNQSLGFGEQSNRFWFTFRNVAFQPGELRAVSYDKSGQKISETTCKTAGSPTSLKLKLIKGPDGFHADGSDMILVETQVVDANGQRCPFAGDRISFEVSGPAEYIGGIAPGENTYDGSKQLPVEAGVNRILLRSTRQSGKVKIKASSNQLGWDTLSVDSKPVKVINGLSTYFPDAKQTTSLKRGATPLFGSYVVSRVPISVLDISAGSNAKDVILSFDDNERTEWRSSGLLSTAWISYKLARQTQLSEVVLKLSGWRNRSSQIRILNENGTVLWEGTTDKSLGYITLPLNKGIVSSSIRVELPGAGKETDPALSKARLEPNKSLDFLDKESRDELRIVEIEFYESVE